MAIRLVLQGGQAEGGRRIPLRPGENVVGSDASADVCIAHESISRRHAVLRVSGGSVEVEDLGSKNGTHVAGRGVRHALLAAGDRLKLGALEATIEQVPDEDLEAGWTLPGQPPATSSHAIAAGSTASFGALDAFTLKHLPRILEAIAAGGNPMSVAGHVGRALHEVLACSAVTVTDRESVLFSSSVTGAAPGPSAKASHGDIEVEVAAIENASELPPSSKKLLRSAALLVALAGRSPAARPARPVATVREIEPPQPQSLSAEVQLIFRDAARVAAGDVSVLIQGESGTGKELLARFLHAASPRSDGPFVPLNCAALPRDLLESELFGIEKGVATGVESRPGKFELADKGTLFLDEIGDMSVETQARILRVLQEHEVYRLGGREPRLTRVRVVAATNRDIAAMIDRGTFRGDLYHRIASWCVTMPPLRRRTADIPSLAAHFLTREAARRSVSVVGISKAAVAALARYPWPGNVRELENEIARAVLFLSDGELLDTARLKPAIAQGAHAAGRGSLKTTLEHVEREEIARVLAETGGDVPEAAARLGVSVATLYRRIKALAPSQP